MFAELANSIGISQGLLIGLLVVVLLIVVGMLSFRTLAVVDITRGVTVGGGFMLGLGLPSGREGFKNPAFGTGGTLLQEMTAPGITSVMPSDAYF